MAPRTSKRLKRVFTKLRQKGWSDSTGRSDPTGLIEPAWASERIREGKKWYWRREIVFHAYEGWVFTRTEAVLGYLLCRQKD